MPSLLAVPDKFRSTATATEVAGAVARSARDAGWDAEEIPLSDGGEGFLEVYGRAEGASLRAARVNGPLGDRVDAEWGLAGTTAIVEMARASGLELAGGPEHNDSLRASTRGTGELIATAMAAGAKKIVVGCGGSATTDGGEGAIDALRPHARLAGVEMVVACDVRTPFLEAANRFAGQKGATESQVAFLSRRLAALATRYRDEFGVDVTGLEGAGAAGGLAGGLAALGARLTPGFDEVSAAVGLEEKIAAADLVVTGEGYFDAESLEGKVVGCVADIARQKHVPVVAVVGEADVGAAPRFHVISLTDRYGRERALGETVLCIEQAVAAYLSELTG